MEGKLYNILINSDNNGWRKFDDIEYTEKEANMLLRDLRKYSKDCNLKFRKKCIYNGPLFSLCCITVRGNAQ